MPSTRRMSGEATGAAGAPPANWIVVMVMAILLSGSRYDECARITALRT